MQDRGESWEDHATLERVRGPRKPGGPRQSVRRCGTSLRPSASAAARALPQTGSARKPAAYLPRLSACSTSHTSSAESDASARVATPAETPTTETGDRQGDKPGAEKLHTHKRFDGTKSARISQLSQGWRMSRLAGPELQRTRAEAAQKQKRFRGKPAPEGPKSSLLTY